LPGEKSSCRKKLREENEQNNYGWFLADGHRCDIFAITDLQDRYTVCFDIIYLPDRLYALDTKFYNNRWFNRNRYFWISLHLTIVRGTLVRIITIIIIIKCAYYTRIRLPRVYMMSAAYLGRASRVLLPCRGAYR